MPDASTSTMPQAWGISPALRAMFSAIILADGRGGHAPILAVNPASVSSPRTSRCARCCSTSLRVTRPPLPEPGIAAMGQGPCCSASRLTAGEKRAATVERLAGPGRYLCSYRVRSLGGGRICGRSPAGERSPRRWDQQRSPLDQRAQGVGRRGGCWRGPRPPASISAITAPIGRVSPSAATILATTPDTGEGISMFTLSVITSTKGSYLRTA